MEIQGLIKVINRLMNSNDIFEKNYIKKMIYNDYSCIKKEEELNFTFPLTVLVGRNGSGKTKLLHSIYGCPENKSVGEYWFSTELDPIISPKYSYLCKDDEREVRLVKYAKRKRKRDGVEDFDPDYWETERINKTEKEKYELDLSKSRYKPLKKNCIYIDSKTQLSAFDLIFNFSGNDETTSRIKKKNYIRKKAKSLKKSIYNSQIYKNGGKIQNEEPHVVKKEVLKEATYILSKQYVGVKKIKHKHYRYWGESIYLNDKYSEACAGSGELKIFNLIEKVMEAPQKSLILIDEPEMYLHPGAQVRLLKFLLDQIKRKHHQIVMASHSSAIIKTLPKEAIKVLVQGIDDKVSIVENIEPLKAFCYLGEVVDDQKINIIAEDVMAAKIITRVLENKDWKKRFNIVPSPGGADDIQLTSIPAIISTNCYQKQYVFLDGDKKTQYKTKYKGVSREIYSNKKKYKKILEQDIKGLTGSEASKVRIVKSSKETEEKCCLRYEEYLKFLEERVFYLPKNIPEDIIFNENDDQIKLAKTKIGTKFEKYDSKKKIYETANIMCGNDVGEKPTDGAIDTIKSRLIKGWSEKSDDYRFIENCLNKMIPNS